jgi:hypothetical protein
LRTNGIVLASVRQLCAVVQHIAMEVENVFFESNLVCYSVTSDVLSVMIQHWMKVEKFNCWPTRARRYVLILWHLFGNN